MPFGIALEPAVLEQWLGDQSPTVPGTLYVGLIIQCGALSSALTAGTAYTSLACAASGGGAIAAYSGASGDDILLGAGSTSQTVKSSALWASSATSIAVDSFVANASYAAGTPFIRCDVYAVAQEPSSGSYARVSSTNNTTNWPNASAVSGAPGYQSQNGASITFPQATASWGTVSGFLIGSSATPGSGSVYFYGVLNAAQLISTGNTPTFNADSLTVSLV